ncbi:MAG: COX15/CtaA family protein [Burkholderiaceae bacterium]|nr:COX15/CtaA family protein [Burkholderiaceae bacterium]
MIRWLAIVACALTVCITASSAFIRHSQAGLGCPDWPDGACVAGLRATKVDARPGVPADPQPAARADAQSAAQTGSQPAAQPGVAPPGVRTARALHRVSAMLVGVLVLLVAVFGWSSMRFGARVALVIALADTAFLAWLGRFTPHPIPLVTIANLVGGIALAAAFAWIAASLRSPAKPGAATGAAPGTSARIGAAPASIGSAFDARGRIVAPPAVLAAALALLAAVAWIGTMIGAQDAIGVCDGASCAGAVRLDVGTLDAFRPVTSIDAAAGRGLHWLHRIVAAAFTIVVLVVAVRARRSGASRVAMLLVVLLIAQIAAGLDTTVGVWPLGTATLHNAVATLLAVALTAIAARGR